MSVHIEALLITPRFGFSPSVPQNIFQYVGDLNENLPKYEKYLEGETPLISDEFKARLKAHVIDGYKGNIK